MDQLAYDAAQRGLLECLLDDDHEARLQAFVQGLRRDNRWTEAQIDEVESQLRQILSADHPAQGALLSKREKEVLQLFARGHAAKDIGEKLDLSSKTVDTYKGRALAKLGLETRVQVVEYARRQGWL